MIEIQTEMITTEPIKSVEIPAKAEVQIQNHLGLYARPAIEFVQRARRFESEIELQVGESLYSAKLVTDVLLAYLVPGTRVTLLARGPDSQTAVEALGGFLRHLADADSVDQASTNSSGRVASSPFAASQSGLNSFD
jgi:phosphotransferase system HPr (HPr) family protein